MILKYNILYEVKKLLLKLPVYSNCNVLLADSSGDMIVVECNKKIS